MWCNTCGTLLESDLKCSYPLLLHQYSISLTHVSICDLQGHIAGPVVTCERPCCPSTRTNLPAFVAIDAPMPLHHKPSFRFATTPGPSETHKRRRIRRWCVSTHPSTAYYPQLPSQVGMTPSTMKNLAASLAYSLL